MHEFVAPFLAEVGSWPMVGTAAWRQLGADDPAKLAAIYDAARHWALRTETSQQALADASRDIAAAADWPEVAREIQQRRGAYISRAGV
ncbi:hypothetical protein MSHI_01150 [Mycobacterium shinjukuense]|uniref:DUF2742 domain-containing protein n=1 Tax=Mycobacterium shinjukuense TaxID=398694 RepID=A0A7I7MLQ1_9MYCO|nr:DUF2742 domain-containing protein [Mycobacterium shinjukuense]BBX72209.1 hypothetical protein MSHI_01150 [Mycobacterium shinjukuense]